MHQICLFSCFLFKKFDWSVLKFRINTSIELSCEPKIYHFLCNFCRRTPDGAQNSDESRPASRFVASFTNFTPIFGLESNFLILNRPFRSQRKQSRLSPTPKKFSNWTFCRWNPAFLGIFRRLSDFGRLSRPSASLNRVFMHQIDCNEAGKGLFNSRRFCLQLGDWHRNFKA